MYQEYDTFIVMDDNSCVIYAGEKYTLEWYYDKNGKVSHMTIFWILLKNRGVNSWFQLKEWEIWGKYMT